MDSAYITKYLNKILHKEAPEEINKEVEGLISLLRNTLSPESDIFNEPGDNFLFVINELNNIKEVYTSERKKYYLNRIIKSLTEVKTTNFNDINLNRWKEYTDLKTDSLWLFSKRDRSGSHSGKYWGNFIPQIPNQLLRRYTKKGDWVLDPFSGGGTTLIECRHLKRNVLGLDISPDAIKETEEKLAGEENNNSTCVDVICANSLKFDYEEYLNKKGIKNFQFVILHPPYWDIIKFSDDPDDLSNCSESEDYLRMIGELIDKIYGFLEEDRFLALVIGDKYNKGEWTPLGFYAMQEIQKRGLKLKSIIIKNFEETRGKMQQKELWRYRALAGGFYIFKHEYIFLFRKPRNSETGKVKMDFDDRSETD